jgi:hypothetical protein
VTLILEVWWIALLVADTVKRTVLMQKYGVREDISRNSHWVCGYSKGDIDISVIIFK